MFARATEPFCFEIECHLLRQPLGLISRESTGMDSLNRHTGEVTVKEGRREFYKGGWYECASTLFAFET